ncbi:hypothetical protein MNBD_ALPHA06-1397 [hydrothermal vent metagenome]|uniref:Uncharacterized protein n=1 Tax=hydrothermal vent metagenome TaxID=652676 RepID=A0A3B0R9X9_9ZZZZ
MYWINKSILISGFWLVAFGAMAQSRTGVEVGQLSEIEPFSISVIDKPQKKLPPDQWQNSTANIIEELLEELAVNGGSAMLNDLLGQVLLSGGTPPPGGNDLASLRRLRLQSALALGRFSAVSEILSRSPGAYKDPELTAIAVNALLAQGNTVTACALSQQLSQARGASFWLQMRAFCLAIQGNTAGAELTAELAITAADGNPNFLNWINRLTTPAETKKTVDVQSYLELAMAEAANTFASNQNLPSGLRVALARWPDEQSLPVLMQVFADGLVPVNVVAERLFAHAKTLAKPEPETPTEQTGEQVTPLTVLELELATLNQIKTDTGIDLIASLFALGHNAQSQAVRAEALALLLQIEQPFKSWAAMHRLVAEEIKTIAPEPVLARYAPAFAKAALVTGNVSSAKKWLQLLPPEERAALSLQQVLFAIGGPALPAQQTPDDILVTDVFSTIALGRKLSPKLRHWLSSKNAGNTKNCPIGKQTALISSARQHALAETVFRAADILRNDSFASLPPLCAMSVIEALRTVGLKQQARLGALEWMFEQRAAK